MYEANEQPIAEKAATLGRILTTFQLAAGHDMPAPLLRAQATTIKKVAEDLIAIIDANEAATSVAFDPTLGPSVAALLGEVYGEQVPDSLPAWLDGCPDEEDGAEHMAFGAAPATARGLLGYADVPLRLEYREFSETLQADRVGAGLYRLRTFSNFVTLAPGDIVTVDEDTMTLTDWKELEAMWVVQVFFDLSIDESKQQEKVEDWGLEATVQYEGTQTALLACASRQWIEEHVQSDAIVSMVRLVRFPGSTLHLATAISDI